MEGLWVYLGKEPKKQSPHKAGFVLRGVPWRAEHFTKPGKRGGWLTSLHHPKTESTVRMTMNFIQA